MRCCLAAVLVVFLWTPRLTAEPLTLDTAPPVVVKTVPAAGMSNVDPGLAEIKVTFSKPMLDKSWSWTQNAKANFPTIVGQPKYLEDGRTCVVQVKLEPNHTYVVGMNSKSFQNFKDREGRASMPYLLVFRTGAAK